MTFLPLLLGSLVVVKAGRYLVGVPLSLTASNENEAMPVTKCNTSRAEVCVVTLSSMKTSAHLEFGVMEGETLQLHHYMDSTVLVRVIPPGDGLTNARPETVGPGGRRTTRIVAETTGIYKIKVQNIANTAAVYTLSIRRNA